jgi:phosphatidylserine decarboxylase
MSEKTASNERRPRIPGLDAEATPLISLGLGLTGLILGLRPRFAAWPLALTAATALLFRDPKRVTPDEPTTLFAPADGTLIGIDELYEHRFLHTEAMRLAIVATPMDVPVQRAPTSGVVAYAEHIPGEHRSILELGAGDSNERQYLGLMTDYGPILLSLIAGPLARRITTRVEPDDRVEAGARLSTIRFGSRVDLLLPTDLCYDLPAIGTKLTAGESVVARLATT